MQYSFLKFNIQRKEGKTIIDLLKIQNRATSSNRKKEQRGRQGSIISWIIKHIFKIFFSQNDYSSFRTPYSFTNKNMKKISFLNLVICLLCSNLAGLLSLYFWMMSTFNWKELTKRIDESKALYEDMFRISCSLQRGRDTFFLSVIGI